MASVNRPTVPQERSAGGTKSSETGSHGSSAGRSISSASGSSRYSRSRNRPMPLCGFLSSSCGVGGVGFGSGVITGRTTGGCRLGRRALIDGGTAGMACVFFDTGEASSGCSTGRKRRVRSVTGAAGAGSSGGGAGGDAGSSFGAAAGGSCGGVSGGAAFSCGGTGGASPPNSRRIDSTENSLVSASLGAEVFSFSCSDSVDMVVILSDGLLRKAELRRRQRH